jgi:hypothetical protein
MLETGELLRTWRLSAPPAVPARIRCESLPDHRATYLDYEGPVSGGRGCVRRVTAGEFVLLDETPGSVVVKLRAPELNAIVSLTPPFGRGHADFAFHHDQG